ncbi:hypothetical protein C4D60_Mb02t01560 [Musa balbisiana]|uniref:Uncharacterized protein n=1 Tax=Musa balbisiana TaxID=52838 RepID=A0A4V4H2D3_MUSBA|nr:hypothetical protein C4D60_Mb02t01560 [Musa balbisiana]
MDHDLRRRGQDLVKEGLYMISVMPTQAISIKFLETLVCGYLGGWMATMVGWKLFVAIFLSLVQSVVFQISSSIANLLLGGKVEVVRSSSTYIHSSDSSSVEDTDIY